MFGTEGCAAGSTPPAGTGLFRTSRCYSDKKAGGPCRFQISVAGRVMTRCVAAALIASLVPSFAFAAKKNLSIGIVTAQLEATGAQSFAPFISWLDSRVNDAEFHMVQFNTIEDLVKAVENSQIDFAFATPVAMVELNVRSGARAIATVMQPLPGGQNYPWLAGAAFVRDSRSDIQRLEDVRGKRVIALSPLALGGWPSVVREWRKQGIREDAELANVSFVFSYAKVAQAVCDGQADIGVLSAGTLLGVAGNCREKLRVLPGPGGGKDPRYPTPVSTELYPEEAFAVTRESDEALVSQVSTALLAIEPGSEVARAAIVGGFTAPLNYEPVQLLMQELRLRPFESYGRLTFRQAFEQYGRWVSVVLLAFLAILAWALMQSWKLNKRLRLSEEFRQRVFEGSHLPIVVMDAETRRYLDCNHAATAIYGLASREETLSRSPIDVSAAVQADGSSSEQRIQEYIDRAMAMGIVAFEWRHRRPNGEIWDAEVHLMSFESGQKQLLQFTLEDITERKRSEAELRLANFTVENASVGILWGTIHGRFMRVNRVACAMTGFSEEELLGMSVADLDPRPPDGDNEAVLSRIRQAEHFTFESRHRHKDGHTFPVEISACLLDFEGTAYVVSFVQDITERKRAEERQTILASVVEASHDFIGIGTLEGEVTYLNKGAKALVGLEGFEPSRRLRIADFFPPKEMQSFAESAMPVLLREGWVRKEFRLRHFRSGEPIPVEVEGILIRELNGTPICLATVTRDLTERYASERQRVKLEMQLVQAQKMEALGRLTGGIAHDFNNSLTVILGYAALVGASERLSEKERAAIKGIADAGRRSKDLVGQLLGFSRQQIIAPSPLNLNQTLVDSKQILARLLGEDVDLEVIPGENLWSVLLDTTQVDQVLMNLAANARDAMPHGGKLTLETSNAAIDSADARKNPAMQPGDYVLLTVSDTGIGMDEATAAQVFEPFFTTKDQGEGTGLGLATVYGIVRQNDGFINLYSEPDRGTTFNIYFPRFAGACAEAAEEAAETRPGVGKGNILLVEDDELVRNMTADTLLFLGYTPLVAGNAQEAINICENLATPIDLAISDVVMPGMRGTELRDRLIGIRPGLKVLFMSGYTSNVIVRHGVLKPGVHFLQKPFSVENLGARIEEILA